MILFETKLCNLKLFCHLNGSLLPLLFSALKLNSRKFAIEKKKDENDEELKITSIHCLHHHRHRH